MPLGKQLFLDHPGFIVKGTPGIGKPHYIQLCACVCQSMFPSLLPSNIMDYSVGKTTFLNLLVYYAAQLNTNVILHDAPTKSMFLLRKDGTVDDLKCVIPHEMRTPSTLYLFNPDEENTQADKTYCFTVIVTSPDQRHFSNVRKTPDMYELYLAPWTLKEALDANRTLPPDLRLDESIIQERFLLVGGSIRYLLYPTLEYIATTTEVLGELNSLTVRELKRWHSLIQSEQSVGDLKAPHYLFHCEPNKKNGGITCILRFAAFNTEALIMDHIKIETDAELTSLVDFLMQINPSRSSSTLYSCLHAKLQR